MSTRQLNFLKTVSFVTCLSTAANTLIFVGFHLWGLLVFNTIYVICFYAIYRALSLSKQGYRNLYLVVITALICHAVAILRIETQNGCVFLFIPLVSILIGCEHTMVWNIIGGILSISTTIIPAGEYFPEIFVPHLSDEVHAFYQSTCTITFFVVSSLLLFKFNRDIKDMLFVRRRMLAIVSHEVICFKNYTIKTSY
jgi:hypothetical protein